MQHYSNELFPPDDRGALGGFFFFRGGPLNFNESEAARSPHTAIGRRFRKSAQAEDGARFLPLTLKPARLLFLSRRVHDEAA